MREIILILISLLISSEIFTLNDHSVDRVSSSNEIAAIIPPTLNVDVESSKANPSTVESTSVKSPGTTNFDSKPLPAINVTVDEPNSNDVVTKLSGAQNVSNESVRDKLSSKTNSNELKSTTTSTSTSTSTKKPIREKPSFTNEADEYHNIEINKSKLLDCTVIDSEYLPLNCTWHKDEKLVPEMSNHTFWEFKAKMVNQSGNYECEVCNEDGCIQRTFVVTILVPESKYVVRCAGESVDFTCGRYGKSGQIEFYRKFINETETLSKYKPLSEDNGDEKFRYTFNDLTVNDTDWYSCYSANKATKGELRNIYINVTNECHISPATNKGTDVDILVVIIIFICVIFVALVIVGVGFVCCMKNYARRIEMERESLQLQTMLVEKSCYKRLYVEMRKTNESSDEVLFDIEIKPYYVDKNLQECNANSAYHDYIIPPDTNWEFPKDQIQFDKIIGQGAFGTIYRAEAYGILEPYIASTVAVKKLRDHPNDDNLRALMIEMETMKRIGKHENIISLLKCCTQEGELFVIMEYAGNGSLKDFFKKCLDGNEFNPSGDLIDEMVSLRFSLQIAKGMEYLASRKCVHRDLAARNILVTDDYNMKIADFGLARNVTEKDYYRQTSDGRLPFKWMAPEALTRNMNTTQSDVWSFGIVVWEIFTMGGMPYPTINNFEIERVLKNGTRLDKPDNCSIDTFRLMRECWRYDPKDRPSFSHIVEELKNLINQVGVSWQVQSSSSESLSDDSDAESSR